MSDGDILNEVEAHAETARLIRVRQLIEAILREHDFCGDFVLCGRGRLEIFAHLEASWSTIRLVKDGDAHLLTLKCKKEDYSSPKEQDAALRATAGMARSLAEIHLDHFHEWAQASAYIDDAIGAIHDPLTQVKDQGGLH